MNGSTIGNADFLRAVFHALPEPAAPVVAAFTGDPNHQPPDAWSVHPVNGTLPPVLRPGTNQYFSIASVTRDPSGRYSRRHPAAVHALVIDDIGTNGKVDPESVTLAPSWELETSPDNCQWGYILEEPITDLGLFRRVLTALKQKGFTDPNGNNPVRLVRLPEGINGKAAVIDHHGEPFACTLHQWAPERRYTLAALIEGLGLDLEPPRTEPPAEPAPEPDAPWSRERARKLAWDAARRTHADPDLGRHAEIYRLGCYAARDGLPAAALDFLLAEFAEHMRPCDTSGEVSGINWEAERSTIRDGHRDGRRDRTEPDEDRGQASEEPPEPIRPRQRFRLVHVRELLSEPDPLRWLVDDWLPPESQVLLFGDPASGKSLIAIDWAASIATGRAWCHRQTAQGPVIYIAGEGHQGIRRRLKAWAEHHQCEAVLSDAPLVVSETGAALVDPSSLGAVIEAADETARLFGRPALIVIDTLHRNLGPGDENSAQDIAIFVRAADTLRTRFGCTVLTVHHSGHGEKARARGSSAIRAAVDAEFLVESHTDGARTLSCPAKMKDAPKPAPIGFALREVELPWFKANGEPETSVVLAPHAAGTAPRRRNAPPGLRLAFGALLAALDSDGEPPPEGFALTPIPPEVVHLDAWRSEFYARHTGDTTESKKKAFQRARAALVDGHAAGCWEDYYWASAAQNLGCGWSDLVALDQARTLARLANEAA